MSTNKKSKRRSKKKRKLNTRLLTIASLVTVILIGVVGGLVYLKFKGGVTRNMAAAQAYLEEGRHTKALRSVGKVLYSESGNQDAHELRIAIYEDMVPTTNERAASLYREYIGAISQHAQFTPKSEELAERVLGELWIAAMARDVVPLWRMLETTAKQIRARFKVGSPAYGEATFMLGMARMRLGQSNFLGDVDQTGHVRFPGEAELTEFIGLEPNSDRGNAAIAFGRMAVARQLGVKGQEQQEIRNLKMAQASYDQAMKANPEGPATLLAVIRHLFIHELMSELRSPGGTDELKIKLSELNTHLIEAERVISAMDGVERHQVIELARFLQLIDLENGHERAAAVLDLWVRDHPLDLNVRILLAVELQAIGRLDEAEALTRGVVDSEPLRVSLASDRQHMDRMYAATILFGIISDRRDEADTALLKRDAEEVRDTAVDLLGGDSENSIILQMNAHLAYAAGNYSKAVSAFERAYRLNSKMPVQFLRENADALERIGQGGTAVKRLEATILAEPRSVGNRLLLAALHGRMRNPEAALVALESLPVDVRENNLQVVQLEQSLRISMLDESERLEEALAGDDLVMRAIVRADQLDKNDQLNEAKELLATLKADGHEDDVRLLIALGQVELRLGNREAALAIIEQAAAIQPDNHQIENMVLGLSSDDPIEVLQGIIEQQYPEGEERTVAWFLALQALALNEEQIAKRTSNTDEDRSAKASETADRARSEAAPLVDVVNAASSTNPQAFGYKFDQLLKNEQFAEAEALLPIARKNDWGQTKGNLAEASLLMARGRATRAAGGDGMQYFARAAAAGRRATDVAPWRGVTWQTLAEAMLEVGNLEEARLAYAQVIQRDPSDVESTRQLAALHLREGGEKSRAVSLLADASRRDPSNASLREAWLRIEAAHGNKALALGERFRSWKKNPADRQAALWYAVLVASLPVDRAYVLDKEGEPSLSGREWLQMSTAQQKTALELLKKKWLLQIDEITEVLAQSPNSTFREALQHATVLRESGRQDELAELLQTWLDQQKDAQYVTKQAIQAARFLGSSDRFWEAKIMLDRYRDAQDPAVMEVDAAIGDMLHASGLCNEALPYLISVGEATGSLAMRLRAADCLLRLQRLDEAEEVVFLLKSEYPEDYKIQMLIAGFHRGRGVVAESSGDVENSMTHRAAFRDALEQASDMDPTRTLPFVQLVESLVIEYRRTLDRQHLEEATRYLEAASQIGSSSQLVLQQADVQEALGDPRQAVLDLEEYLRQSPQDKKVRARLAQSFVTAGMPGRAIDTIEQAIAVNPRDPYWHGLLGDHLRQSGTDFSRAMTHYIDAWEIEPSRRRLTALVEATRTTEAWDYEAAIEAIRKDQELTVSDPQIIGLRARAEAGLGQSSRARESLREAYALYTAAIATDEIADTFLENWYADLYVIFPDGDGVEALELRNEIVGDSPNVWDQRGLARFYGWRGGDDMSKAESIQSSVIALQDAEYLLDDLHRLGSYQLGAKMHTKAVETFKQILELRPNDAISLNNYAYLLATILNDPEAAEPFSLRAVALRPREASFIDTMASIQLQLGRHEAALSSLMTKLSLQPNNAALLQLIARTLVDDLGRPGKAFPFAKKALDLDPRGAEALDLAGWIAWKAGQQAKGRDWVGQSIRRQPTAMAHLHMAQILAGANEMAQARDHLRQSENMATDESMRDKIKTIRRDFDDNS